MARRETFVLALLACVLYALRQSMRSKSSKKVPSGFMIEDEPPYNPTAWSVTKLAVLEHVRQCGIMTAVCLAAWQPYVAVVRWCKRRGWSERMIVAVLATAAHGAVYWGMNSFFELCDRRRWLEEFKLERTEAMGPSEPLVRSAKLEAFVGQFVTGPPVFLFLVHPMAARSGMPAIDARLPSAAKLFGGFFAFLVVNDWAFYWAHRLFHDRRIYKHIHKQHHEFKGTVGWAGEHAHLVEQIVANQVPAAAGWIFGGSHFLVFMTYLVCRLTRVYEGHSGYCFYNTWMHKLGLTWAEATAYHDFHHTTNIGNFGSEYLDYFFGSMDAWIKVGGVRGYLAQKRPGAFGNILNNDHPSRRPAASPGTV